MIDNIKKPKTTARKKIAKCPLNLDYRLYTVNLPPDLYAAIKGCKIKAS